MNSLDVKIYEAIQHIHLPFPSAVASSTHHAMAIFSKQIRQGGKDELGCVGEGVGTQAKTRNDGLMSDDRRRYMSAEIRLRQRLAGCFGWLIS